MANNRSGLQKKVSSIFDGTPVQNKNSKNDKRYSIPEKKELDKPSAEKRSIPLETKKSEKKQLHKSTVKTETFSGRLKQKLFKPNPDVNPKKQMALAALIPILAVVFVFTISNAFDMPSSESETVQTEASDTVQKQELTDIGKWLNVEPYPENLRDPMRQGGMGINLNSDEDGPIDLKGIVYSNNPRVTIGGKMYKQGDIVNGAEIIEIRKNEVEFKKDGKTWVQKPR